MTCISNSPILPASLPERKSALPLEKPDGNIKLLDSITNTELYKNLSHFGIFYGPIVASIGHLVASISDIVNFSKISGPWSKFFDNSALLISKVLLTANSAFNAIKAFQANRIWEFAARILEPFFIIIEKRTEDLGLARGIGLGLSQVVEAQGGIVKELADSFDISKPSPYQDHVFNQFASKKLGKELLTDGFGSKRRILTGFTLANLKDKLGKFGQIFNLASFSDLISGKGSLIERYERFIEKSGFKYIQEICAGDQSKDKGHTTAFSGYLMMFGSILGYMDKAKKGLLYKIGGTFRNAGGALADIGIFGHPDPYFNVSALFLSVNTVMDIVQRFIPPHLKKLILLWSNLSMSAYNTGVGIYLNRSAQKTDRNETVKNYRADDLHREINKQNLASTKAMAA